jgi:hypothetical protein
MTVLPRIPDRVGLRLGRPWRARRASQLDLLSVTARGLLIGIGVGIVVVAGARDVESIAGIGVLALGAALLSWDK